MTLMSQKLSPPLVIAILVAGVAALALVLYLSYRAAAPQEGGDSLAPASQAVRGQAISKMRNQSGSQ